MLSGEDPCGGGRGGRPLVVDDMPRSLVSSRLDDDKDSAERHWPDEMPPCALSSLPPASVGLLLRRLSRFMVAARWEQRSHLR